MITKSSRTNAVQDLVGLSEMRFETCLQLAILYGFDPVNENQVAICSRLLTTITAAYFYAFRSYAVAFRPFSLFFVDTSFFV